MSWTKAELEQWCQAFTRTPANVLKAFIDAGLCSDQSPAREQTRLASPAPDAGLVDVEDWEREDQIELSRLYNHKPDDSLQFNRTQMRTAIRHGRSLSLASLSQGRDGLVEALPADVRAMLLAMRLGYGWPAKDMVTRVGEEGPQITEKRAAELHRAFATLGWAWFHPFCDEDSTAIRGRGYSLSPQGDKIAAALREDSQ